MKPSVHVVTHFVSPYQVELFNAVAAAGAVELFVSYRYSKWSARSWEQVALEHPHALLDRPQPAADIQGRVQRADFVVFNLYRDRLARQLMRQRARQRQPWAFWGERPAYRVKGRLGTYYRYWRLAPLRRSAAPIWGIGSWATAKYREEFGSDRPYADFPYYSDLDRFRMSDSTAAERRLPRNLLFSGSLSQRKGVDLLAAAFQRLAAEHPDLSLTILGSGQLEARLRSELASLGKSVRFAGFQDWRSLPEWYLAADVLIAPSRYDGWGLIVAEGLAAGLPVVASDQMGAAVDLVRPGRNGWIFEAGNAELLTNCCREAVALTAEQFAAIRQAACRSVAGHQLSDGVQRFVELCEAGLRDWKK